MTDRPIVVPYNRFTVANDVYLPGDEPVNAALSVVMRCEACETDMPTWAVDTVDGEDGDIHLCSDTESCRSRIRTLRAKPESRSFIMDAINRIVARVDELESWRRASGSALVVPAVGASCKEAPTADQLDLWHVLGYTEDGVLYEPDLTTRARVMSRIETVGCTLARADARAIPMDDNTVDLIVTSPPYWAQRSYTDGGGTHYAGQIGDEPTYDEFLDNLITCMRDWIRVLKPSGSIWVNLGDKYSNASNGKPKSLLGLPWRYALRCIDELGLILREEIIWSKPNGMPEPVTDRCRRSHEQWFHFTINPAYYSAVDRIRLQDTPGSHKRGPNASFNPDRTDSTKEVLPTNPLGALPSSVWDIATAGLTVPEWLGVDHYAAYPTELPRRIIQGFSPENVCTACGEGRRPFKTVIREGGHIRKKVDGRFLGKRKTEGMTADRMSLQNQDAIGAHTGYKTWHNLAGEICACTPYTEHPGGIEVGVPALPWREYHLDEWEPPASRPGVVVDPFGGTGTTVLVAEIYGRHGVHLDLSADYLKIAEWRTTDPAQRASAMQVPRPPIQMSGQLDLMAMLGDNEDE